MILGTVATTFLAAAVFLTAPKPANAATETNLAATATLPGLPSGVTEVMKLYKGGISADIMVSYINNSPLLFYLSADNIIALQQQGVPAPVLTAMIQRYGQLQRHPTMPVGEPAQAQAPARAPAPQYSYSGYPPENPEANFNAALQARAAAGIAYAPSPYTYAVSSYPVYAPAPAYYDPFFEPWDPFYGSVVFDVGFGHFGGGFRHVGGYGGHYGGGGGHLGGGSGHLGGGGGGHGGHR
jgi:hypothetical protein